MKICKFRGCQRNAEYACPVHGGLCDDHARTLDAMNWAICPRRGCGRRLHCILSGPVAVSPPSMAAAGPSPRQDHPHIAGDVTCLCVTCANGRDSSESK